MPAYANTQNNPTGVSTYDRPFFQHKSHVMGFVCSHTEIVAIEWPLCIMVVLCLCNLYMRILQSRVAVASSCFQVSEMYVLFIYLVVLELSRLASVSPAGHGRSLHQC